MSSGVVPHYRPCLFAWYLTIDHACWSVLHFNRQLSADGRGMVTSLVLLLQRYHYIRHVADPVPLSDMSACTVQLYQHSCWLHLFRYMCLQSGSLSSKYLVCYKIHQTCLQVRCGYHGSVKLISYYPGRHLEYIKF